VGRAAVAHGPRAAADRRLTGITGAQGFLVWSRGDTLRLEVLRLTGPGSRPLIVQAGSQLVVVLGPGVSVSQEVRERLREQPEIPPRPPTRAEWGRAGLTAAAVVALGVLLYIGMREVIDGLLGGS
jgi:hypothetical protein